MSLVVQPEMVEQVGLVYVSDALPGITRKRSGKGFGYYAPDGSLVKDPRILRRIRGLVIPPAYTNVWICPIENGHIQATGRDAKGRKQYRYHPQWTALASQGKFSHVRAFGGALLKIRKAIDADLGRHGLPKEKVLATVVWFLDSALIRIGNEEYARQNRHYGLTTMKSRHVTVEGSNVQFHFVGKRGIKQDVMLADRRMARIVKKIQELPGQDLFQYVDSEGQRRSISSADVNQYLREISGDDFTAKDFRTWAGTVTALECLSGCLEVTTGRQAKSAVVSAVRTAAAHLHNTPAICRKSYIHPGVIECYLSGAMKGILGLRQESDEELRAWYSEAELIALDLLARVEEPPRAEAA